MPNPDSKANKFAEQVAFYYSKMSAREQEIHDWASEVTTKLIESMTPTIAENLELQGMREALARNVSHTVLQMALRRTVVCSAKAAIGIDKDQFLAQMATEWDRWDVDVAELPDVIPAPDDLN